MDPTAIRPIDDNTVQWLFGPDIDNIHDIYTLTLELDGSWQMEEFLNIEVHLNLSKSKMSIFICEELHKESDLQHFKLTYEAINNVTILNEASPGIHPDYRFAKLNSSMSRKSFLQSIDFLLEYNLISKNEKFLKTTSNAKYHLNFHSSI